MNKRFAIAWLATFTVWMVGSFIVHGALLQADYTGLSGMFRPEQDAQQYLSFMLLAQW